VTDDESRRLAELPVHDTASDRPYYTLRRDPSIVLQAWREDLSALYELGGLLNVTIHPRGDYGSGRALRIEQVAKFLQALNEYPRLWRATCGEIADWTLGRASS
jgi:hypothetical protein